MNKHTSALVSPELMAIIYICVRAFVTSKRPSGCRRLKKYVVTKRVHSMCYFVYWLNAFYTFTTRNKQANSLRVSVIRAGKKYPSGTY